MSPPALRRYRAERLLRKEFPALRSKVLTVVRSQLRTKGVTLDPADLEACYAVAWQGLYTKTLGGEQVDNPSAWLVLVTFRRAIDEARSAGRAHVGGHTHSPPSDLDGAVESGYVRCDPDFAGALDDRVRLRQLFEGLRSRLSARECEAASLCYLQGLSRAEAARQMGIGEARMRKLMEGTGRGQPGVAGKVGQLLDTIGGGGWCEQQSSLMRAYAFGVLDPVG
ncbi:MAG: sigma-70 family RNA polymerase sigma factor, partial [Solirubrobacteraceae bacterium]